MAADIIFDHVQRWATAKDGQDALVKRWQDLEDALSRRIGALQMNLEDAAQSDLFEARTMRILMRKIESYDRSLSRQAKRIVQLRSTSLTGALAKIEIALRMHYPAAGEEDKWALVVSAVQDLREIAETESSLELT